MIHHRIIVLYICVILLSSHFNIIEKEEMGHHKPLYIIDLTIIITIYLVKFIILSKSRRIFQLHIAMANAGNTNL